MIKDILLVLFIVGMDVFLIISIATLFKDVSDKERENYRDEEI